MSSALTFRFGGPAHRLFLFLLQDFLRVQRRKQMHETRDRSGPSCLVARADTRARVTVEVLIE
jgi:hypothetical protein